MGVNKYLYKQQKCDRLHCLNEGEHFVDELCMMFCRVCKDSFDSWFSRRRHDATEQTTKMSLLCGESFGKQLEERGPDEIMNVDWNDEKKPESEEES